MTRYQQGFNPLVGGVELPDTDEMATARDSYVAGGKKKVSASQPFYRAFDLWSTALRLAVAEDLDPMPYERAERRKFHDNIGTLIAPDIPLMALIATVAVRHGYRYESRTFEDAIAILDEPAEQTKIANIYAHAGALRLLELLRSQPSAAGPAITRHFQKLLSEQAAGQTS